MAIYKACYVDDRSSEAHKYINQLNAVGGLEVSYLAPPPDLSLAQIRAGTQMFLVDWELSARQGSGVGVRYNGGTFAQRLREQFEHTPIVLTSRNGKSNRWRRVNPYLFDAEIRADEMEQEPACVVKRCVSLISGFDKLAQAEKTWPGLMEVLGVMREDEQEQLGEAAPPLLKADGHTTWLVPEIAKWLQEVLLGYPGILYDALHAATYLGIDVEEFLKPDVQAFVKEARYTGVLAPAEGRWWKGRLLSLAIALIIDAGITRASVYDHFALSFAQLHGRTLQLAECIYSQEKPASRVCYVLKKPVLIEHSLTYLPDNRPLVMDEARVSFTAIQTSDNVFDEYFDAASRHLLEDIRSGDEDEW